MKLSSKNRRWLLIAGLSITLVAVASINNHESSDEAVVQVSSSKNRANQMRPEQVATGGESNGIPLANLKRPAMPEKIRDMFASQSWYVPPPQTRTIVVPVAPPLPFVYIGKMKDGESNMVVFLEKQNRTYAAKVGDAIDKNYRVDAIQAPVMTLTYLPLDIKQTMQIGEAN